jgi:hypothetical protein
MDSRSALGACLCSDALDLSPGPPVGGEEGEE